MYIAGWKCLETPNVVKILPNLVLEKFCFNLISVSTPLEPEKGLTGAQVMHGGSMYVPTRT